MTVQKAKEQVKSLASNARRKSKGARFPNTHEWALIGFFIMTFFMLYMIKSNPALLGIPSFMQFVGQLATGGVLLGASWLFSGNKTQDVVVKNDDKEPVPTEAQ